MLIELIQPHPKPPTPPLMWTMFFTIPIMAYIIKGGEIWMVELVKVKKIATLDFGRTLWI